MIKFDTINGQLCIMLDKPEPLTTESKFPCVVRLIQDDSPMGRLNKRNYDELLAVIEIINGYNVMQKTRIHNMVMAIEKLEIIGYPVADGSAGWALYQMMQGKSVQGAYWGDSVIAEKCVNNYMVKRQRESYEQQNKHHPVVVCANTFIAKAEPMGWQLYEPEPDYRVGDWVEVECQTGTKKWTEQCKVICIYRDGDGYGVNFHGDHQPVTYDGEPFSLHLMGFVRVIRKLSPSDVIVKIGCLSGTVRCCDNENICPESTPDNPCHFVLQDQITGFWSIIYFKMLDAPTRELVESLLKAQEEK